jgi:hypothetical protein
MKISVVALSLAILAEKSLAINYLVALKNIGHINDNSAGGETFTALKGDIQCVSSVGCVGSGVIRVARSGLLDVEAYPDHNDYYSVSIMCESASQRISSCDAGCSSRSGYTCTTPWVMEDSNGDGCTVVGRGHNTDEVEVSVRCQ